MEQTPQAESVAAMTIVCTLGNDKCIELLDVLLIRRVGAEDLTAAEGLGIIRDSHARS